MPEPDRQPAERLLTLWRDRPVHIPCLGEFCPMCMDAFAAAVERRATAAMRERVREQQLAIKVALVALRCAGFEPNLEAEPVGLRHAGGRLLAALAGSPEKEPADE